MMLNPSVFNQSTGMFKPCIPVGGMLQRGYITDDRIGVDNSKSESLHIEESIDVIAKEPYILIEEPEVEVMNMQTDDILFDIMTRSRDV